MTSASLHRAIGIMVTKHNFLWNVNGGGCSCGSI